MAWLLGCVYARDRDLFRNPDYWQHPCNFEGLRKGDCEDFALWAWCATKAHGGYSYVAMVAAAQEMRVGPSKPSYTRGFKPPTAAALKRRW